MTDHRTNATGTIDYDHYRQQGRGLRNEALRDVGAALRRGLASLTDRRVAPRIHVKTRPNAKA